jgi:hypothetical protein
VGCFWVARHAYFAPVFSRLVHRAFRFASRVPEHTGDSHSDVAALSDVVAALHISTCAAARALT